MNMFFSLIVLGRLFDGIWSIHLSNFFDTIEILDDSSSRPGQVPTLVDSFIITSHFICRSWSYHVSPMVKTSINPGWLVYRPKLTHVTTIGESSINPGQFMFIPWSIHLSTTVDSCKDADKIKCRPSSRLYKRFFLLNLWFLMNKAFLLFFDSFIDTDCLLYQMFCSTNIFWPLSIHLAILLDSCLDPDRFTYRYWLTQRPWLIYLSNLLEYKSKPW